MEESQQLFCIASNISRHHASPMLPPTDLSASHSKGSWLFHFLLRVVATSFPAPGALPPPHEPFPLVTQRMKSLEHRPPPPTSSFHALPVPKPSLLSEASLLPVHPPAPGASLCSQTRGHAALQLDASQLCAHHQLPKILP